MKRLITLAIAIILLFSAISCGGNSTKIPSTPTTTEAATTTATPTASPSTPITPSPEPNFYAGYARVDITPETPVPIYNQMSTGVSDRLYATVIAVSDGENKALFITADLKNSQDPILSKTFRLAEKYGVPSDNVFLSVTHNHSTVDYAGSAYELVRWRYLYYDAIEEGIKNALDDLKPTSAEIGTAHTPNFAFVRRYIMEDGSFKGIHTTNPSKAYKQHETEADDEMQVIRFNRENAKDIVIVNWQAHPAHAVDMFPTVITADFVHFFREGAEEKFDIHFAFFQGASGNINLKTYFPERQIYKNYIEVGRALPDVLGEALENMTPIELGEIKVERVGFDVTVNHEDDDLYPIALEVVQETDEEKKKELIKKYGFQSKYEASSIVTRYKYGKTNTFSLTAISFGDLGFASAPYEMFDTNGMEIKNGSPFKMTFVCSCTNGSWSYIAADHAYDNGGYEVYNCKYVRGTAEALANELIRLLTKQYNAEN